MADVDGFAEDIRQKQIDLFRDYVGQGKRYSYERLSDVTGIKADTLRTYAGGVTMPLHVALRLFPVLTIGCNEFLRGVGFKLAPLDPETDDWDGIGAEASMLTFEIFEAQKDGKVDHREREKIKARCRSLDAKLAGVLE